MLVLAARDRVQVDHAVDAVRRRAGATARESRSKPLESHSKGARLEMALVDRQPHAVHAERRQELRVLGREEAVEQPLEERDPPVSAPTTAETASRMALSFAG